MYRSKLNNKWAKMDASMTFHMIKFSCTYAQSTPLKYQVSLALPISSPLTLSPILYLTPSFSLIVCRNAHFATRHDTTHKTVIHRARMLQYVRWQCQLVSIRAPNNRLFLLFHCIQNWFGCWSYRSITVIYISFTASMVRRLEVIIEVEIELKKKNDPTK